MHKVIAVGKVEDLKKWEEGFRTHAELFKSQSVVSPIEFANPEGGNEVAVLFQVSDLDEYLKALESPATAEAMKHDGIDRETVKIFVLDKQFTF